MSRFSDKIDTKTLYNDLQTAIREDKQYWVRNNAKIRAAVTSQNYDEFREIVAAAHLTPLTKNDKTKKLHTWNCAASNKSEKE